MSTSKTADTERRYSDICGASNSDDEPCGLPAGWGTPGSGGDRCRFHGGASTGPKDTEHLENNDFAENNAGGGAPALNTNAQTANGIWSDWRKVYERLDGDKKEYVERIAESIIDSSEPHTPDMDADRRERLAREDAVLRVLKGRVDFDIYAGLDTGGQEPAADARGVMVEEEVVVDGESYTIDKQNPALDRRGQVTARQRAIREELRYYERHTDAGEP